MWTSKPTLIIKKLDSGKYTWMMYLSNNRKRPTCISPTQYEDAFKARARAKEFAAKFRGPMRLIDRENKTEEVFIVDETRRGQHTDLPDEDEIS